MVLGQLGGGNTGQEVEVLFQSKSIAEVREVETATRNEIKEKKKQLRQVVGGSYRDLISSADTIIDINKSCHSLVGLVRDIQGGLGQLSGSILERQHSTQDEHSNTSYDKLFALGSRVKYLLDTPENIWGCLDSRDFLEASRRFVRSAEVHKALSGHSRHLLARFPLLQHQWPLVKKFRQQIWDRAVDWLRSQGELSSEQLASTLLALALLKPMDGGELLKTYLSARQRYIMQCLEAAVGGGPATDLDTLTVVLGDVLVLVCRVVAQAGELFLQLPGVTSAPLLLKVLTQDDLGLADLAFDPKPSDKSEIAAWKAAQEAACERLGGLAAAQVAAQCSSWLDQLASHFKDMGGKLLGSCDSGQDLLTAEGGVREALAAWEFELLGDNPTPAAAPTMSTEASQDLSATLESPASSLAPQKLSWDDASQWVLGRPLGLWPLLVEHSLVERAKELVARDFTTVVGEVTALLGKALEDANSLPAAAPGDYISSSWSEMIILQPGTPPAPGGGRAGRRRHGGRRRGSAGGDGGEGDGQTAARAWLQQTEQALQLFDQQLSSALAAALHACYGPTANSSAVGPPSGARPSAGASGAGAAKRGAKGEYAAGRALVLEPFVQNRCLGAALAIASTLEARLQELPLPPGAGTAPEASAAFAPTAQKALIVGRVALAIAGRSTALQVILGPPDLWGQATARGGNSVGSVGSAGGLLGRSGSDLARRLGGVGAPGMPGAGLGGGAGGLQAPSISSPQLEGVQQRFRFLGLQAYSTWAGWASQSLSTELVAGLASDLALVTDTPLRGWEETIVSPGEEAEADLLGDGGGAGGAAGAEMRFWLPAAPSAAAMSVALRACREADHAGGHLIDEEGLSLLKWQLGGALLGMLGSALAPGGQLAARRLSEKGLLQVLLDARFLHDLFSLGGPPPSARPDEGPSAPGAAITARKRELAKLEEGLQSQVDPIDWATYESYLYANKDKFAGRCQVLFGLLLRSEPASQSRRAPALAAASVAADSNVLRMAVGGPRFSYLPVNTPALLRHSSSTLAHSASGNLARAGSFGSSGALPAAPPSPHDKFGTALFGRVHGRSSSGGEEQRAQRGGDGAGAAAAAGAAGGPGVGASALDALRHSKLGSLLGDKAADVTARAQQTLGEYSFSTLAGALGGGGLLSAFGKSEGRAK